MRKTAYQVKRVLIGSLSFWQNSQIYSEISCYVIFLLKKLCKFVNEL